VIEWPKTQTLINNARYPSAVMVFVINMGTKILNCLPIELRNEMNLNVFKRKLKGYLICNVFYSLKEFC
jgi:hypothetical protein